MSERTKKSELAGQLDAYFLMLLGEAQASKLAESTPDGGAGSGLPPISFLDRLRLAAEMVRWVAVKNKVDPDEAHDAFGKLRDRFHGKSRVQGRGGPSAAPEPNGGEPGDTGADPRLANLALGRAALAAKRSGIPSDDSPPAA